jgi:hypothetical protein
MTGFLTKGRSETNKNKKGEVKKIIVTEWNGKRLKRQRKMSAW